MKIPKHFFERPSRARRFGRRIAPLLAPAENQTEYTTYRKRRSGVFVRGLNYHIIKHGRARETYCRVALQRRFALRPRQNRRARSRKGVASARSLSCVPPPFLGFWRLINLPGIFMNRERTTPAATSVVYLCTK